MSIKGHMPCKYWFFGRVYYLRYLRFWALNQRNKIKDIRDVYGIDTEYSGVFVLEIPWMQIIVTIGTDGIGIFDDGLLFNCGEGEFFYAMISGRIIQREILFAERVFTICPFSRL